MCVSGCPYKKIYYNWSSGKSEKCTFCYPRIEAGQPTVCSETCVGRIRYLGRDLLRRRQDRRGSVDAEDRTFIERNSTCSLTRNDPAVMNRPRRPTAFPSVDRVCQEIARLERWRWTGRSPSRCIRNTGPCRWSGISRRFPRSSRRRGRQDRLWTATCRMSAPCAFRSNTWPTC